MLDLETDTLVEALAEAMETMAFVALAPAEDPARGPAQAVCVSIGFAGRISGRMELVTDPAVGRLIAGNILGDEAEAGQAEVRGIDALKELLNVTCGVALSRLAPNSARCEMHVPQVREFDVAGEWEAFVASAPGGVFDADGYPMTIRLIEGH